MSWRSSCSGIIFVAFANAGTAVAGDHLPPVYKAPPLPADRPFDWTGFYVGGSVGEHWGTHTGRVVGTAVVPVTGSGDDPFDFSPINHNAAVAGGQVGFNRQVDRWVFGAEGSFEHSPVKQTVRGLGSAIFLADDDFRFSSDWQASARVRAGIAQARKEGRPHGRPRSASLKADEVLRLKAERVSHSEIARQLGIGRTSVRRILTEGRIDSPSDRV